ncbi:hypothetical protein IGI04_009413 [Brassica rapa subsp. trilocularis]|uniref:Uncharacterized protein n=1 Tax=Brassica rapa subsp. trilocularis TaxID=1813537 RepID=A0ABQ7MX82_BRACM|nr:hypothetical protein IGI04_009413 [Brassica rapa subsp. trilocularis]
MAKKLLLLLLLIILSSHANCGSIVKFLPGFEGPLPFQLETGGDHDLMAPFISTQAWIRSLNYSIVEKWRPWMIHNQVAGYTQTYANKMTYATGGGHTPEYKPKESFIMFQRWISGQPL